ncbi:VWA domain-containing protein, partial [Myxococcota bacterium]|nr:VWA domain-containing protein [Myxococcota bacterium]
MHSLRRRSALLPQLLIWSILLSMPVGCQDYPFETRLPQYVKAKRISEVVATVTPTDILLVVDNSGSMADEIDELRNNLGIFVDELAKAEMDFHLAVITPDIECNVPEQDCVNGPTSYGCCNRNPTLCEESDSDTDSDDLIDFSNCDGGRLRSSDGQAPFYKGRPEEGGRDAWVTDLAATVTALGLKGSGYEATFEAVRRAVACAGDSVVDCPEENITQINQGFLRDDADLVVIFLTDEDDCSAVSADAYYRPLAPWSESDQSVRFCSPDSCYAHYNALSDGGNDSDDDGIWDWCDADSGPIIECLTDNPSLTTTRLVNPPLLQDVGYFVDALVAAKNGEIGRVRAAAILGGVADTSARFGYKSAACIGGSVGPTDVCGCWSSRSTTTDNSDIFCRVTDVMDQDSGRYPVGDGPEDPGGCVALPGNRYVDFLEDLADKRIDAGYSPFTLVDSICKNDYSDTLRAIVNTVILTYCFDLGVVPESQHDLVVRLNGEVIEHVERGGDEPGWSWVAGRSDICLEG